MRRDGRIVNANMSEDTIAGPLGVKGLVELVMVGVPAAVTNAVFNATGKRITEHWTNCSSRQAP